MNLFNQGSIIYKNNLKILYLFINLNSQILITSQNKYQKNKPLKFNLKSSFKI